MRLCLTIAAIMFLLFAVSGIVSDNPVWAEKNKGFEDIRPAPDENEKQGNSNRDSPSGKTAESDEDADEYEIDFDEDGKC